jgi:hypothetical protein
METDEDLEIEILRTRSRLLSRIPLKVCLGDLFTWLAQKRFEGAPPKTREECRRVLENDVSRQLYDVAISNRWFPLLQVGRPVRATFSSIAPESAHQANRHARGGHRLPTLREARNANWATQLLDQEIHFLKTQKAAQEAAATGRTLAVPPVVGKPRRRGPPVTIRHAEIAAIVRKHGAGWRSESALEAICDELQQKQIPLPIAWAKWRPTPRSWGRGLEYRKRNVIKQLEYSLKKAPFR